jgi:AhpD family alkylhydroperoxidase
MDWFWRPTATPERIAPWLHELRENVVGLVDAFRPGHPSLSPRDRERIALVVTEVNGCRPASWVHESWARFLGEGEPDELLPDLLDFAREAALTGRPIDDRALERTIPPDAVRAVRATVAITELSCLVGNTADGLWHRLTFRRPLDPGAVLWESAVVAASLPFVAPAFLAAGAMRLATLAAPPLPVIEQPDDDDANLLVHLVADALPGLLSNALLRSAVLRLGHPLVVGMRTEDAGATVRIGRDRIVIENGVAPDANVVIEDGADLLVEAASRALGRELDALTTRQP